MGFLQYLSVQYLDRTKQTFINRWIIKMAGIPKIERLHLKILFLSHLALSTLSFMSWGGTIYNVIFLVSFLWVFVQPTSGEAASMAMLVNLLAIVLEIVIYALFTVWGVIAGFRLWISVIMGILNFALRFYSSWVLYGHWVQNNNLAGSSS